MGRTKQLLLLDDKPVIRHCIDALFAADVADIVVVVSTADNGIAEALSGLPVTVAVNTTAGSDMAESVRTGFRVLDHSSSAVLVCLSDHPLVSPLSIMALMDMHNRFPDKIIIPCYQGRRGHPGLFPRTVLDEIFSKITLRDIVRKESGRVLELPGLDEGVVFDMDTRDDYERLVGLFGRNK